MSPTWYMNLARRILATFVDAEKQIAILQKVITDLRKSQVSDRPILSIEASAPGQGNMSVLDDSARESQLSTASFM